MAIYLSFPCPQFQELEMAVSFLQIFALLALISTSAIASEPFPVQDFCVADKTSNVFMNGFACKDPTLVTADDFFYSGLNKRGNTSNPVGSKVTLLNADKIPGLNTFGISMARVDFIPGGLNPPHTHPRATEILTVIQGKLFAGFVTVNPDNRFYSKVLKRGDVFVFPQGLIHFQINIGRRNAVAIVGLSSQNPGVNTIANAMFGARPEIPSFVLAKGFQTEEDIIRLMQSKF